MAWPVGAVHLNVADLSAAASFYQQKIGLAVLDEGNGSVRLGAPDSQTHLLTLTEQPGGQPSAGGTGLYHFALLLPSRRELGRVLRHFAVTQTPLQGLSDHGVSEAIYLADPEGNGIEIYRDRPRDEWPMGGAGVEMITQAMDVDGVLAAADTAGAFESLPPETIMGHIHLHVASTSEARRFYGDLLGLDLMQQMAGSALFMSRERYHHHVGLNVWRRGAPSVIEPDTLGLRWYVLDLGDEKPGAVARLQDADVPMEQRDDGLFVRDPAGNGIVLV